MNEAINTKQTYNEDFDKNFEFAYELSSKNFSHNELINMLQKGNIPEKQIAALKFDYVADATDAQALLNNLTGCDGKIREAVALKINTLLTNNVQTMNIFAPISADILAAATIDINANICRLAVDSAAMLASDKNFSVKYTNKIIQYTKEALVELDKFIFRDKKYVINKQLFKLYWCLEALSVFYNYSEDTVMKEILEKCAAQNEYTIREKVAQILTKTDKFNHLTEKLINDENYYVRQILHH